MALAAEIWWRSASKGVGMTNASGRAWRALGESPPPYVDTVSAVDAGEVLRKGGPLWGLGF